ncbi:MAG: hypothetical protein AAF358_02320 [Pseudomonadota bacterium]
MFWRWLLRRAAAFLVAALATYVLATVAATQFALQRIVDLGLPVSPLQRATTTGQDLLGMAQLYLPILAVGLAVALLMAGLLSRWWRAGRYLLMIAAGFGSVLAANLIMNWAFDITPIAAARSLAGLLTQGAAGLVGGWLFARMTTPPAAE